MAIHSPRVGDFNFSTVVSSFDFDLADLEHHELLHGLPVQSQYLYGGFRSEDGDLYVVERKFALAFTGGLWLMSSEGGNLNLLPGSINSARGELVREFTPNTRKYTDHLMHKVGKDNAPNAEAFDCYIDNDVMRWSEGDLLNLEGKVCSKGMQYFAPMRDRPLIYVSVPYWMKGKVMGKDVEGAVFFDHLYFKHGVEWKEYSWYTDVQVSWNVFANMYEDGSFEWGHIVKGTNDFAAGIVIDDKFGTTTCSAIDVEYQLDDDDCVARGKYAMGGETWEFTGDEDGKMLQFNKARWGGYRAQGGVTRRMGDDRKLANGWTWLECFADRMRDHDWVK